MAGYDFEIIGEEVHDHKCPICMLLLRKACLLPCSHSACNECLIKWEQQAASRDYRCPSCYRTYERPKVHTGEEGKFIDRLITTSLKVKCKQHLQNCNWVGTISDYEIHDKSCPEKAVSCDFPGCDVIVVRKDLIHHQRHCGQRIVECQYCIEKLRFYEIDQHQGICDSYDVPCEQGCDQTFKRKDAPAHIAEDCPYTIISCPYQEMGCTQETLRMTLTNHMNSNVQEHCNQILNCTLSLTQQIRELKQNNTKLHSEIRHLKEKTSELEVELEKLSISKEYRSEGYTEFKATVDLTTNEYMD